MIYEAKACSQMFGPARRRWACAPLAVALLGAGLAGCLTDEPRVTNPPGTPGPARLTLDAVDGAFTSLGETKQLRAIVTDAGGGFLTNVPVDWTSSDPAIVSVSDLGLARAISNGGTQITAQVAALSATVDVFVIQVVASLTTAEGDGQAGLAGAQLTQPLVTTAYDALGSPVANAAIAWSVLAGGGSVNPTQSATGGSGAAQTFWTLGAAGSAQEVQARLAGGGGLQALFGATATATAPAAR